MTNYVNNFFPGEIYPDELVAGCIAIFENAWPSPEETIDSLEKECKDPYSGMSWKKAETIDNGLNQNARSNYDLSITNSALYYSNPVAQNIHNQMNLLLLASTIPYAKQFSIGQMYHEGYNILRYQSGEGYSAHFDGGSDTGRVLSAICYLNNDFSGGELEFINFGLKIKPEPGMLILFPSNYAYSHIAHNITDGTKYAIVTWIKDRPDV